jgi:O-antigen/teichoic acid export membrane protein
MTNYTKKAIRGSAGIFLFSLLGGLSGYIGRVFLSSRLSVEDFGLFFAVFGLVSFLELFKTLGLGTGLVKYISEYRALKKYDELKTSIYVSVTIIFTFISIVSILLLILSKFLSIHYFKEAKAFPIIIILAIWYFTSGIQGIIFTVFYGFQRMFMYCLRELRSILYLIILLILFYFGTDILFPAYSWLVSSLIIIIVFLPILL